MHITEHPYNVCVIDVGGPKNIGWCFIDPIVMVPEIPKTERYLEEVSQLIANRLKDRGVALALEAPLFIPMRKDCMKLTSIRQGEKTRGGQPRPWSVFAGAGSLTANLPCMGYLFDKIRELNPETEFIIKQNDFTGAPNQLFICEAFIVGEDKVKTTNKGDAHVADATNLANTMIKRAKSGHFPENVLKPEPDTKYLNLIATILIHLGITDDISLMYETSPVYRPDEKLED